MLETAGTERTFEKAAKKTGTTQDEAAALKAYRIYLVFLLRISIHKVDIIRK